MALNHLASFELLSTILPGLKSAILMVSQPALKLAKQSALKPALKCQSTHLKL